MPYNSYTRHSIRWQGHDYSSSGMYFVTICTQNKQCLFGEIVDCEMLLNNTGIATRKCWLDIPIHFPHVLLHQFVIMPNHIHGILENVGADLCVCPINAENNLGEHAGSPLHRIIQWFKTITTNHYINGVKNHGWQPFYLKIWQRNYYEHIIRNEKSYHSITNYIAGNPINWQSDNYYIN